jgi:urease subunit gamma/beta
VIPGVAELVSQIRVEVLLEEGTRLIVLSQPIGGAAPAKAAPGTVGERA